MNGFMSGWVLARAIYEADARRREQKAAEDGRSSPFLKISVKGKAAIDMKNRIISVDERGNGARCTSVFIVDTGYQD